MKENQKNIYRIIVVVSFIGINAFLLFGISQIYTFLNTGADRTSMLRLNKIKDHNYQPKMEWSNLENPGREMEEETLKTIEKDYANAWYVRKVAYLQNDSLGIKDYYTQSARKNLFKTIDYNKNQNIFIEGTTLSHHPKLDFYSADGQLVVFTDENIKEYQKFYHNNRLLSSQYSTNAFQVMMLLEDGFWKIRHLVKKKPKKEQDTLIKKSIFEIKNDEIYKEGELFRIKGINYYPQETPWDMFGESFDISNIKSDFELLKSEGLNTLRIFVQYSDFGKATVAEEKLDKLKQVLDTAQDKDLKVIVTLFDFYGDYSILDWTLTHRHAETIVTSFKKHPAILAWDIKNEPNLDFENRGKVLVLEWLSEMIDQIRSYDPNHLITIGWSDPESASLLQEKLDFISFHYYLRLEDFPQVFAKLKNDIDKPLVLQEYGISSYSGFWNPLGNNAKDQKEFHQKFAEYIQEFEVNFISWTLYDFNQIPSSVVGKLPWRVQKQKHFGFVDKNGNRKLSFPFINPLAKEK